MIICKDLYAQQCRDYSVEIEALAEIVLPDCRIPADTQEALRLFVTITTEIDRLEM